MLSQEIPIVCPLCQRPMTTSGEHQICAIGCGHIFGYSCIMDYFANYPTCPLCNENIHQRDILLLFFDNCIKYSEDTLKEEHKKTQELEETHRVLEAKYKNYKEDFKKLQESMIANKTETYKQEEKRVIQVLSQPSLILDHDVNDANRVMFCGDKLILSEKGPDEYYGIQITDVGDPDTFTFYPLHKMQIKDICAYNNSPNIIVTVSMDQNIGIVDTVTNQTKVISFGIGLWCCAFVSPDIIYIGGDRGTLIGYDIRKNQKVFESCEVGPPTISLDLISDDTLFVCTGRIGRQFNIKTMKYNNTDIVNNATIVRADRSSHSMVILTRKNKLAHALVCTVINGKINPTNNIPIRYFSRLVRPSLCQANGKMYYLLSNQDENDITLLESGHTDINLWLKWKNRFSSQENQIVDLDMCISDDFLIASLTQTSLRIYALPIKL